MLEKSGYEIAEAIWKGALTLILLAGAVGVTVWAIWTVTPMLWAWAISLF